MKKYIYLFYEARYSDKNKFIDEREHIFNVHTCVKSTDPIVFTCLLHYLRNIHGFSKHWVVLWLLRINSLNSAVGKLPGHHVCISHAISVKMHSSSLKSNQRKRLLIVGSPLVSRSLCFYHWFTLCRVHT